MSKKVDLQLDMFNLLAPNKVEHVKEDLPDGPPTNGFRPKQGAPQYMAAQAIFHEIDYTKLNNWQKTILWPHLKIRIEDIGKMVHQWEMWFELGYVVAALDVEMLMSRLSANEIAKKYGADFFFTRGNFPVMPRDPEEIEAEHDQLKIGTLTDEQQPAVLDT